jgi:hypothetical protein
VVVLRGSGDAGVHGSPVVRVAVPWRVPPTVSPLPPPHRVSPILYQRAAKPKFESLRYGLRVGDRSRGPFRDARLFPSLYKTVARTHNVHVRRETLGVVHRSRAIFCRPVPNLSVTIRNLFASLYCTPTGVAPAFNRRLIQQLRAVSAGDCVAAIHAHFLPLFDPALSACAVCCNPAKVEETLAKFAEMQHPLENIVALEDAFADCAVALKVRGSVHALRRANNWWGAIGRRLNKPNGR